ncbi:MAG: hypothetical protein AB7F88_15290 [Pyrinomonadaceae bacterium]
MWEKFLGAVKDFIIAGELTRRNSDDIRELRRRNEDLSILVERLAFEVQRLRENEAHEREKLLLRFDAKPKQIRKQLPKKRSK